MSFEPQKFFIGVMEFFSILLPGAILTWLMKDAVLRMLSGERASADLGGVESWVAFGVVSYLVGHLLFLVGSWLDVAYDWLRRRTRNRQIDRILRGATVSPRVVRLLVWFVFKRERDLAVERAGVVKKSALGPLSATDAVNTFQWSKAFLHEQSPSALAAVQRLEADSKFFRCFTVLLLVLLVTWWWWQPRPAAAVVILLFLLPLSFWRFMDQRYKATNQAYWFVIALAAKSAARPDRQSGKSPNSGLPTHAGGVVFRRRRGQVEYLLVESTECENEWVAPKGHIERSETPKRTAVREVHEETGVWARPVGLLREIEWKQESTTVRSRFFLMRYLGRGAGDERRRHEWLPLEGALMKSTYDDTRALLAKADERRIELERFAKRSPPV